MTKRALIGLNISGKGNSAIFILVETSCNVLFLKILSACHADKRK